MKSFPLVLDAMPEFTDEAAAQCLDFLQELSVVFENHYATQLRRYYEQRYSEQRYCEPTSTQMDLFGDDDLIPF